MSADHRLRVDQSAEYAELVNVLKHPGRGGALVLGGSGMGKTSLVQAALARTDIPVPAMRLHCTPTLAAIPYGALSPYLSTLDRIEDPVQVLREVNTVIFASRDGESLPIVVVEDAQFLDSESSFVLSMLVENAAVKVVAIGAGRIDGESTLFSLTESGLLATLVVQPFDTAGVRFLAEELTAGGLTDGSVEVIRAMTGGNPSFVKAFVQSCLDQGVLVKDVGTASSDGESSELWMLARLAPEPDEGLIELVREMHSSLPAAQQRILEILALGGPQPRDLLVACAGGDYRHLLESGVLITDRDGLIQIRAEIHGIVLRHVVAPGRSAELHAQWVEHKAQHGPEPTPLRVLWGLEVAAEISAEEALAAVEAANNQLDYPLAWKLCAVAGIAAISERGTLLEARTLLGLGRYYSARAALMRLAEKTSNPTTLQQSLNMLFMTLSQLGFENRDLEALEYLWRGRAQVAGNQRAFTAAAAEHQRTNELLDLWREVQNSENGPHPLEDVERILAKPGLSVEGRTIALVMLSDLHSVAGRTETALGLVHQAMSALDQDARLAGDYQLLVLFRIGWNLVFSGRYAEAEEFLATRRGTTVRLLMHRHGVFSLVRGIGQLLQGQTHRARKTLTEAIAEFRLRDPSQLLSLALTLRGFADSRTTPALSTKARRGDVSTKSADFGGTAPGGVPSPRRVLARAVAAGAHGPEYEELSGYPLLEREVLVGAAGRLLGDDRETREFSQRLLDVAQDMEGQRSGFLVRLADPQTMKEPLAAVGLSREARAAGEYQVAAEAMARAAMLYSAAEDARACGASLRELMELLRESHVVPDPYVARALALAELTTREEEIVDLAREGKNNAEIARALTVSQRTVEGHLYRVFSKLGITDRSELTGLCLYAGNYGG